MFENTEGAIKRGNPEKLATYGTQGTGQISLTFICPMFCVPYVTSFSGLSFFIALSVFSNFYLSCVLCILWCQFHREYPSDNKKGQFRETGNIGYTRHRTNKC
jgi:hypothetical protein